MADWNSTTMGVKRSSGSNYGRQYASNPAENYEEYFVPAIGAGVAAALVDAAALKAGERVLDVACGTGTVARLAAKIVGPDGKVAGLDVNPGMLEVARKATPTTLSIDWYTAPAEAMPLPDAAFDVALCAMGLQFFGDKRAALAEVDRVLAPAGRFVANLPGPTPLYFEIMAEELARHVGPEPAAFVHAVFSLHNPDEIEQLGRAAGFSQVRVSSATKTLRLPSPGEFLWQYVYSTPMAAAMANVDDGRRAALERAFISRCQRFVEEGGTGGVKMTTLWASR